MQISIKRRRAIELAIVAAVVTAVLAVVLTNTLNLRNRSRDAAAQALARNALMIQRSHYYGSGEYADAEGLRNGEPAVDATDQLAVQGKVYVRAQGFTTTLASSTPDGTCYWIRDVAGAATYAKAPCETEPTDADFGAAW